MLDLLRCRGRAGRVAALAVGALTIFALTLVATPASAADPADQENFNPNDTPNFGAGNTTLSLMSDRNDGTNTTFHVNTVASLDTSVVDWYYCPTGFDGTGLDPIDGGSGCTLAGTDSSGEQPSGGIGETYELDFNVPDDAEHDWVAWACTTTPKTDANCDQELEDDIQFDDSSTGPAAEQQPAGEITSPANPDNVSNDGFVATATTDPSTTSVIFCVDYGDPSTTPGGSDCQGGNFFPGGMIDDTPDNPAQQQSQFKTWSATLNPDDDSDLAISLIEHTGGATTSLANNCTGDTDDCLLDAHYITSSPAVATSINLGFPDYGDQSTVPNSCYAEDPGGNFEVGPNPNFPTTATVPPESYVRVNGCVFDQSDQRMTDDVETAMQITPVDSAGTTSDETGFDCNDGGVPSSCDLEGPGGTPDHGFDNGPFSFAEQEGEQNDINSDEFFEQNDFDVGTTGVRAGTVVEFHSAGTFNMVFCVDSNDNADKNDPAQSATPCSGEALSANATLTVTPGVDHVHVKRQGTEGPQCHTGSSSTTAPAGSTVNLVGCALAVISPTAGEQPVPNTHVLWFVNPANQPQDPGQVVSQENTTDSAGKADAAVTSGAGAAEKTTTMRFCVDQFPATGGAAQGNGICDSAEPPSGAGPGMQADFQINWTAAAQPTGSCPQVGGYKKKAGNQLNNKLKGGADCDKLRGKGGNDKLSGKGEDDLLVGGRGFDVCRGGPGKDIFRGCEVKRKGSQVAVG